MNISPINQHQSPSLSCKAQIHGFNPYLNGSNSTKLISDAKSAINNITRYGDDKTTISLKNFTHSLNENGLKISGTFTIYNKVLNPIISKLSKLLPLVNILPVKQPELTYSVYLDRFTNESDSLLKNTNNYPLMLLSRLANNAYNASVFVENAEGHLLMSKCTDNNSSPAEILNKYKIDDCNWNRISKLVGNTYQDELVYN